MFKNSEKKKIYYKNILLKNIILLKNKDKIDIILQNEILSYLEKLALLDKKEEENIINIIYYFYQNSLKNNGEDIIYYKNF
jgi:hypothetical protein